MVSFRLNTWDQHIWEDTMNNVYGINSSWPHSIIDIGAHIGSFTYFMMSHRQTKRAIAIEPDYSNYLLLQNNLSNYISNGSVTALYAGIGPANTTLAAHRYVPENTGGMFYIPSENGTIPCVSLDSLIDMIPDDDLILLKLDCEGCEYEAVFSCTKIKRIRCIVGEFHFRYSFNHNSLKNSLESNGFKFGYHFTTSSQDIGLFGAHQP